VCGKQLSNIGENVQEIKMKKVSGGFRTKKDAETFTKISSIMGKSIYTSFFVNLSKITNLDNRLDVKKNKINILVRLFASGLLPKW
jgi:hypothetical protein